MPDDRLIPTQAPADRPSFKLFSNGTQVSAEYQVASVVVEREANRVATARLTIYDGDPAAKAFRVSDAEDFVPGREIEVHAGYHADEEVIFKGLVVRHGLRIYRDRPSVLQVECKDAAVKLTVGRKSAYFYEVTDGDVIEQLAQAAGLTPEVEATTVTHPELVQFYALDWDFVVSRAEAAGLVVYTDDGTLRAVPPDVDGDAVLELAYGGNLLDFEAVMDARDQYAAVKAAAWDQAGQELVEVDAADPGVDTPGNVGAADLAGVVGLDALALRHGGHRADAELQAWADARALRSRLAKVRGRARIQGFGGVRPGDVVALSGVGERFSGTVYVSGVRHEITVENWETDLQLGLSPEAFVASRTDVVDARAAGLVPGVTGLQIGLVTALEGDPKGEHRVQVRTPMIDPAEEGVWARVARPDAGDTRGVFFNPEVGDEVVLGFAGGDPRDAVVLGMLHSSAKAAPLDATDDNHEKGVFTRAGMKLLFDDDQVAVTVETPGGNKAILSDDAGGITLEDQNGNKVTLSSDGITLESAKDVVIKASGDVKTEGTNVQNTANAQFKAEGSAGAEVSSSATTVLKGSLVQIN